MLTGASYWSGGRVSLNVVARWKKGLPARRDEPWFLITDLGKRPAVAVTELYARRMGVEELFRDQRSLRNGSATRRTKIRRADRFDRRLLVLAVAYALLIGIACEREQGAGRASGARTPGPTNAARSPSGG